jgi:ribosomal protein L29
MKISEIKALSVKELNAKLKELGLELQKPPARF